MIQLKSINNRPTQDQLMQSAINQELENIKKLIDFIFETRYEDDDIDRVYAEIRKAPLFHRDIDSVYTQINQFTNESELDAHLIFHRCLLICITCAIKISHYQSDNDLHLCWRYIVLANRCMGMLDQIFIYEEQKAKRRDTMIISSEEEIEKLKYSDPLIYGVFVLLKRNCPDEGWKTLSSAITQLKNEVIPLIELYQKSKFSRSASEDSTAKTEPLKYLAQRINRKRSTDPAFKKMTDAFLTSAINNKKKTKKGIEPSKPIKIESFW